MQAPQSPLDPPPPERPSHDLSPLDLAGDDGRPRRLTLADVLAVARGRQPVRPLEEDPALFRPLEAAMAATVAWVAEQVGAADAPPIYGINTGFGALAGRETFRSPYQARVLSRNLLTSHSAGVGLKLDEDVVRAGLLIRGHQLAQGRSGIRIAVVNRLFGLLNARVYPQVPSMGSLGASGDLAPLAHLALIISRPPEPGPGEPVLPMDRSTGEAWVPLDGAPLDSAPRDLAPPDPAPPNIAENPGALGHSADEQLSADLLLSPDLHQTRDALTGAPEWWRSVPGHVAMERAGGQIELEAKEGLALTNGATLSTALAALALADAARILDHAVLALAMTLEAIRGFCDPFLAEVHAARGFDGAAAVALRVMDYVKGSTLLDAADRDHDPDRVPPQDPYSVRCGPQVLGAVADSLAFIRRTVELEINAAVDNPLIFLDLPRDYKAVSCGNFHGAPIGYAMDLLKIVMTDCASQSERRCFKLTDYRFHDARRRDLSLPAFLIDAGEGMEGLNSGLMIPQYTAAALVSAAKTLAHPDSVDSIPSSANQEDHVSMSMNAGLHARQILGQVEAVVAIELLTAAQALEFRRGQGRPGRGVVSAWDRIRAVVPPLLHDRALAPDIEAVIYLMRSGELVEAART